MAHSSLDRKTIEMMAANMEYIQLGITKNAGAFSKAQWLFYLIKSYSEQVDGEARASAIAERNRLNAGYTKASH